MAWNPETRGRAMGLLMQEYRRRENVNDAAAAVSQATCIPIETLRRWWYQNQRSAKENEQRSIESGNKMTQVLNKPVQVDFNREPEAQPYHPDPLKGRCVWWPLLRNLQHLADEAFEINHPIPKESLFDEIAAVCINKLTFCLRPDEWSKGREAVRAADGQEDQKE